MSVIFHTINLFDLVSLIPWVILSSFIFRFFMFYFALQVTFCGTSFEWLLGLIIIRGAEHKTLFYMLWNMKVDLFLWLLSIELTHLDGPCLLLQFFSSSNWPWNMHLTRAAIETPEPQAAMCKAVVTTWKQHKSKLSEQLNALPVSISLTASPTKKRKKRICDSQQFYVHKFTFYKVYIFAILLKKLPEIFQPSLSIWYQC